jgi:chromate transporter
MKHVVATRHHWLSADQFTDLYSLGQLAPGPNMNMVTVIGDKVGGVAGAVLVLVAFYLPSCTLAFAAGRIWDHFRDSPWRESVQRGLAPITVGLMLSGVYAVGRVASLNAQHSLRHNLITLGLTIAVALAVMARRLNPALLILIAAGIGWFALRAI